MRVWSLIILSAFLLLGLELVPAFAQSNLATINPGWPVYQPLSGTVWQTGEQVNIAWDPSSIQDPEVNIYMYNAGCVTAPCIALAPLLLGSSIVNNGQTTWRVPSILNQFYLGSQYLKISGVNVPDDFITSQNFEVKVADNAIFDSPGQGSLWQVGQTYNIKWSGNNSVKASKLLLSPYYACLYAVPACALAEPAPQVVAEGLLGKTQLAWTVTSASFLGEVRLSLVDDQGSLVAISQVFSIVKDVSWPDQPKIVGKEALLTKIGNFLSEEFKVYGGVAPYTWNVVGELPKGLVLEPMQIQCIAAPCDPPKDSAKLSGTVQSIGTYAFVLHLTDSKGWATFFDVNVTVQSNGIQSLELIPGQVVRAQDKAVRLILDNDTYYTFSSMEDFLGKGYRLFHIKHFSTLDLAGMKAGNFIRPSGTTFRYEGDKTVYYLTSQNCKQAYTSFALFQAWRLQLADILVIGPEELFPVCEENFVRLPDLMAVKGRGKTVYIHEKGRLRPVTSAGAFTALGFNFGEVISLEDGELLRYPFGEEVK